MKVIVKYFNEKIEWGQGMGKMKKSMGKKTRRQDVAFVKISEMCGFCKAKLGIIKLPRGQFDYGRLGLDLAGLLALGLEGET